ncbi:MAG: hypothetical protein N2C14_28915, partial [Planctomycetales bacterium]
MAFWDKVTSLFNGGRVDLAKRFKIRKELTKGTMSTVYRADRLDNGQTVALKILDIEKTKDFEDRF